jgi:hypothetical protein
VLEHNQEPSFESFYEIQHSDRFEGNGNDQISIAGVSTVRAED